MVRCGFATLLGDYPAGYEFKADNTPLHLTHVDALEVDLTYDKLSLILRQVLATQKAFSVKAIAEEFYGPNKDIPVTVLELTPALKRFHTAIMDMLDVQGAVLKRPQFNGDGYNPHISIYGDRKIEIGDDVLIKDISIGVKSGDDDSAVHTIVATIPLS